MRDSIYQVGDTVTVSPDLVEGEGKYVFEGTNITLYVNSDMVKLAGREAKITHVYNFPRKIHYEINISPFNWTADMFDESVIGGIKLDFDLLGGCGL